MGRNVWATEYTPEVLRALHACLLCFHHVRFRSAKGGRGDFADLAADGLIAMHLARFPFTYRSDMSHGKGVWMV